MSDPTKAGASPHVQDAQSFSVQCGVKIPPGGGKGQSFIWLRSPFTQRVVQLPACTCRAQLGRTWSRVVQAVAGGRRHVTMTVGELHIVGAIVRRWDELAKQPLGVRQAGRSMSGGGSWRKGANHAA